MNTLFWWTCKNIFHQAKPRLAANQTTWLPTRRFVAPVRALPGDRNPESTNWGERPPPAGRWEILWRHTPSAPLIGWRPPCPSFVCFHTCFYHWLCNEQWTAWDLAAQRTPGRSALWQIRRRKNSANLWPAPKSLSSWNVRLHFLAKCYFVLHLKKQCRYLYNYLPIFVNFTSYFPTDFKWHARRVSPWISFLFSRVSCYLQQTGSYGTTQVCFIFDSARP